MNFPSGVAPTDVVTRHTTDSTKVENPKLTFKIKSVTISMDLSQKVYGTGPDVYASVASWIDGATLEHLPDVCDASLDMFVHVWRTLCAGQLATKLTSQSAQEFTDLLKVVDKRLLKVKALLRENNP
jgi:hypothetical protein